MPRRPALRREWFEIGKAALRRQIPDAPGYGCPLCLRAAPIPKAFTIEDVPPASIGGTPLVLTCQLCNNTAGHKLDTHVVKGQLIRSFALGEDIKPTKYFGLRVGDERVPVRLAQSDGGVVLIGHERAGSPEQRDAIRNHFKDAVEHSRTDWEFKLDFPMFSQRRESVGWLRSAYLVGFAKFGYGYILRPELQIVLQQLQDPDTDLITDYVIWNHEVPSIERRLALINDPLGMESLSVTMGQATVFLPRPGGDNNIYAQLPRFKERGELQVRGSEIPWPAGPEFLLDFASMSM